MSQYFCIPVVGLAMWLYACRSTGPANDMLAECRKACLRLAESACADSASRSDTDACVRSCTARSKELADIGCRAARARYLSCVGQATIDCTPEKPSKGSDLEQGRKACRREFADLLACQTPCEHAGLRSVGAARIQAHGRPAEVLAETVVVGCSECEKGLSGGTEPAFRCQSPSVCGETCCPCPNARTRYRARVCVDGQCSQPSFTCELARKVVPLDPCVSD